MDTTGNAYPSNGWIAKKLNIARRNVIVNINKLISKGYIEKLDHNGTRFLRIRLSKGIPEDVMIASSGGDDNITDDSDASVTQLDQTIITSKVINKTPISPKGESVLFEEFWRLYPVKKGKKAALKKWNSLRLDNLAEEILSKLKLQIQFDDAWFRGFAPNPLTYLSQERWEDEISYAIKKVNNSANTFNQVVSSQLPGVTYDQNGNTYDPLN